MKSFILVAAVMVALATTGAAQAKGRKGGHSSHHAKSHSSHTRKAHAHSHGGHATAHHNTHATGHARTIAKINVKEHVGAKTVSHTTTSTKATVKAASGTAVTRTTAASYYKSNGVRYEGGYYYSGRNHSHWSESKYSSTWGTTVYLDPGLKVWYYWNEKASCYYPVGSNG
jgi:hypothetical protein